MDPLIRRATAQLAGTLQTFKATVRLQHRTIDCLRTLRHNITFTAVDEADARLLLPYRAIEDGYSAHRLKDVLHLERVR